MASMVYWLHFGIALNSGVNKKLQHCHKNLNWKFSPDTCQNIR